MRTVALLTISNAFMTFAWYGFEYCFMVPANRIGYGMFDAAQLKIIQEVITLVVFAVFSVLYLKEELKWNYAVSFLLIIGAVYFAFREA
jgi:uncharacterized protein (DUF486 family)